MAAWSEWQPLSELNMPPSSDALHQHFIRVAYQNRHAWGNTLNKSPDRLSLTNWGWQHETPDTAPTLVYTTIPIISMNFPERVMCHCKKDCTISCKCCMHGQTCMALCKCKFLLPYNVNKSGEQTDGDRLKERLPRCFQKDKYFNPMYYFQNQNTLQKHT